MESVVAAAKSRHGTCSPSPSDSHTDAGDRPPRAFGLGGPNLRGCVLLLLDGYLPEVLREIETGAGLREKADSYFSGSFANWACR